MDITAVGGKVLEIAKKYRYVLLVLLLGIGLMAVPGKKEKEAQNSPVPTVEKTDTDQTQSLIEILSHLRGAGKVKVLLTYAAGEKTVYQTDEDSATAEENSTNRRETVIITDADRTERGLVTQILPPEYQGAIVVCEGADDPSVRLAIVEAVANATGLSSDRISVLKMK